MDTAKSNASSESKATSSGPITFEQTLDKEYDRIRERRKAIGKPEEKKEKEAPHSMVGLALSGGGIRSATFSLGLLQGFSKHGVLHFFDYLSTVSGGGFAGGWWSAWLSRNDRLKEKPCLFPQKEQAILGRINSRVKKAKEATASDAQKNTQSKQLFSREPEAKTPLDIPDGSASAGRDPIHHLRLFSNYLTPRKGALSADTWRAVTVIIRNLILTWLVLLTVLFAAVLATQTYFAFAHTASTTFLYPYDLTQTQVAIGRLNYRARMKPDSAAIFLARAHDLEVANPTKDWHERNQMLFNPTHRQALNDRLLFAIWPVIAFFGWTVVLAWFWMQTHSSRLYHPGLKAVYSLLIGTGVFSALAWFAPKLAGKVPKVYFEANLAEGAVYLGVWFLVSVALIILILVQAKRAEHGEKARLLGWDTQVLRNRIVKYHARVVMFMSAVTVLLAFGGFGHEVINFMAFQVSHGDSWLSQYVAKSGGYLAAIFAIVGSFYTASKAWPTGGGEIKKDQSAGRLGKIVTNLLPSVILVLLLCYCSWLGHASLSAIILHRNALKYLSTIALAGIGVSFFYAGYEITWEPSVRAPMRTWLAFVSLSIAAAGVYSSSFIPHNSPGIDTVELCAIAAFTLSLVLIVWRLWRTMKNTAAESEDAVKTNRSLLNTSLMILSVAVVGLILYGLGQQSDLTPPSTALVFAAILICGSIVAFEMKWGHGNNVPPLALLLVLSGGLIVLLLGRAFPRWLWSDPNVMMLYCMGILTSLALTVVVIVGWIADPNELSIHSFYKSRLVRAYMGASNPDRRLDEISETNKNDDLPLDRVINTDRGGPYHIVNTTLNLIAAQDLATILRKSDYFTLTRDYCGSLSTGYRETNRYMNGTMTLGTAVAISGAAVSPNMGAKTPSASLAMLLTLFNVRIGYWAPNPARGRWKKEQPRLWPYYVLRELVSQTSKLSSFCYLTDGGHYENTGLYSLFQRGCRYIMVSDNGADPRSSFADLGEALRKIGIDFKVSFEAIDVKSLTPEGGRTQRHFTTCRFTYGESHADELNLSEEDREGILVIFKPGVAKEDLTDIVQYHLEHPDFPQQSTAEQWYNESQFESYRKLGDVSAVTAINAVPTTLKKMVDQKLVIDPNVTATALFEALYDASHPKKEEPSKREKLAAGGVLENA